jgi:hypothetical protein
MVPGVTQAWWLKQIEAFDDGQGTIGERQQLQPLMQLIAVFIEEPALGLFSAGLPSSSRRAALWP